MPIKTIQLNSRAVKTGFGAVGVITLIGALVVAKWGFAHTAALRADIVELAALSVYLGPDDPLTHYSLAVRSEKTFSAEDQEKALREFEIAVSLSPNNYVLWLDLGRARERSGDQQGAELALRRALELAPNYSRVQWALGNALLRQGRYDEAFAEIRKAVTGDVNLTGPAATTAWQVFDGDIDSVRNAIGGHPSANAVLATLLTGRKRYDEAFAIWDRLPSDEKKTTLRETGETLYRQFIEGGKYRFAVRVGTQIGITPTADSIGEVSNGGFEEPVTAQTSNIFSWQIPDGPSPRIGPTDGQKHEGKYSLLMSFGQGSTSYRPVSQTVAVEPGRSYFLVFFYRSDIGTKSKFNWEVTNAVNAKILAASGPLLSVAEWKQIRVPFTVPEDTDGVVVRFSVEDCNPPTCSISGSIWFDDFVFVGE